MPIRPIFQAEFAKNVGFSLIRSYFLSPVKFLHDFERREWRATIYFFSSFSEKYLTRLGTMGKAYSLPSCPDQLAVSYWISDPVTYHVELYP
jgi:hypothetical protein